MPKATPEMRLRAACEAADFTEGETVGFRFDPRRGDYDPTVDLDELGMKYEVMLIRNRKSGAATFEVRFARLTAAES